MADAFAEVSVVALQEVWTRWLGPQRFERKLERLMKQRLVETIPAAGSVERIVRLTQAGRAAALGGRDPEARWRRRWDRRWRLVLFDVPEVRRALRQRLGRKLRTLGFGYLQDSAWISPDSVEEVRTSVQGAVRDVETFLFMEARPCGGETDEELVLGAWNFRLINRNYEACLQILKDTPRTKSVGMAWRKWCEVECKAWWYAVRSDPLLPEPLLPPGYRGREVWELRQEVHRRIIGIR